ncbi:MAG: hypothetical protein JWL68_94 [Actinomycetia bacterium]|nr:hypothetical protein [Actinomycetes bacterium]
MHRDAPAGRLLSAYATGGLLREPGQSLGRILCGHVRRVVSPAKPFLGTYMDWRDAE